MSKPVHGAKQKRANDAKTTDRKPYASPKLERFGSISKLTATSTGSGADSGMMMTCL